MLLFLHRLAERGGQSELHQLLTLERLNAATMMRSRATAGRQ
jgi:hypothetical protein